MYRVPGSVKQDPVQRWHLPDRVFFACGACHILAYVVLGRYAAEGFEPIWIKPAKGYTGNHIVAVRKDGLAFDYHGWSDWQSLLAHATKKADRWWPGWSCDLVPLPKDVLISERKSREFEGLWLRGPEQFLHDAMPRARRFLDRFSAL